MSYHDDGSHTHFEVLGVPSDATYEQIKVAFHRLARVHHPDKNTNTMNGTAPTGSSSTSSSTTPTQHPMGRSTPFARIQQAWEVLRDDDSRQRYINALHQSALHTKLKRGAIIPLSWDEIEEAYDEETGETIHVYDCRCGEEVVIVLPHPPTVGRREDGGHAETGGGTIVECPGCCFVYELTKSRVMQETNPAEGL